MARKLTTALFAASLLATTAAQAQIEATLEFVSEFGEFGFYQQSFPPNQNPPAGFSDPRGITFLDADRVAIADYGNLKVQVCGLDGEDCLWVGGDAVFGRNQPGTFDRPHGIEALGDGRLIVADEDNHWIQRCTVDGTCKVSGQTGREVQEPSSGLGQWAYPNDAAVGPDQLIYGLDTENNRVQIIDSEDLNFTRTFMRSGTAPGQISGARGIDVDADGRVIIADTGNNRIQICDTSANCSTFGNQGSAPGAFNAPVGVEVDTMGRIWVADTGNNRIQACSYQGDCRAFGANAGYEFDAPHDVAVHPNGTVAVVDTGNTKIQIFATESDGFAINAGLNDAWFNPDTAGQGFFFTVYPDIGQLFVANFTFDSERPPEDVTAVLGDPGHRWLTAIGPINGNRASLDVTLTEGGVFDSAQPPVSNTTSYGTFDIEAIDCDTIRLTYDLPAIPQQGVIDLQRVVKDNIVVCEALADGAATR